MAGWRTNHPGAGRCYLHGGNAPVRHGQRSQVLQLAPRIRELVEKHAANEEPLNVMAELATARALLEDYVERYESITAALLAWHDTWEGRYVPLSDPEKTALLNVLAEYEAIVEEMGEDATEKQRGDLQLAQSAVAFLSTPQEPKPRQMLDVADAIRHIDVISKVVHRVEQTRQSGMVSLEQLKRFLFAIERVIVTRVRDEELRTKITDDILAIRV